MKKNVTPAVLAANRLNAKRSTGPLRRDAVKHNALKHGLLTKAIPFRDEHEEREFTKFRHELKTDLRPEDSIQTMLVEEIAVCWWKLRMATAWELKEFSGRRSGAKAAVEAYLESSEDYSPSDWQKHLQDAANAGWELREMTLRADESSEGAIVGKKTRTHQFEARLGSAAESGMRYRSAWKRDLYKALEMLRTLQNGGIGRGQA